MNTGMNYSKANEWIVMEDRFDNQALGKCEAIMCLGNGYIGLRSATEEKYLREKRDYFVAGTFNKFDEEEVTELPNAADILAMEFYIDGEYFTLDQGTIHEYDRQLNLKTGELSRHVVWTSPNGIKLQLDFRRVVSLKELHVTAARVEVTPLNADIHLKVVSEIDGRMSNTGSQHFSDGNKRLYEQTYMQFIQTTTQSGIDFVHNTMPDFELEGTPVEKIQEISLEALKVSRQEGYVRIAAASAAEWDRKVWSKTPIEIDCEDPYDQLAVRFAQYHIDGDITYSAVAYYLATKDLDFMTEKGAEIVFETARLWMDTGHFYKGQFRIHDVTGPDEYTCMVNNNYFTNASAKYNLHWAVRFYELLSEMGKTEPMERIGLTAEEVAEFRHAEECMYLPYDEELGINPQDDSFLQKPVWDFENTPKENYPLLLHYHPLHLYRFQVCKQADTVLAHFIYEDAQSIETIRKSFDYYEKITTHDSSLSTCIYSIVAAKLGDVDKAYDYFGDSAKLDLFNLHHNTRDGIHTANMGGNYMAVVYGFGGLCLKESGIWFAP